MAPWNFERQEVGPHDVQFDIQFYGVCHIDLHQIRDDWDGSIFPMFPGYEIVGKVLEVGSHVKKFKVEILPERVVWLIPAGLAIIVKKD